jgi:hypothetical protein
MMRSTTIATRAYRSTTARSAFIPGRGARGGGGKQLPGAQITPDFVFNNDECDRSVGSVVA